MMNKLNKIVKVHISNLAQGDTVLIDGEMKTVSRHHIKKGFTGWTFESDPHYKTKGYIDAVLFPKWFKGEFVGYDRR